MKLFVLMGASASGKDTILKQILQDCDIKSLITYTTRPIRPNEVDGREYHFITDTKYYMMLEDGLIIESRTYNTVHGEWKYCTVLDEQFANNDKLITINTPVGTSQLIKKFGQDVIPIYIYVPPEDRLMRAFNREKNGKKDFIEMCRRFISDEEDFSQSKLNLLGSQYSTVENNDLDTTINQIKKIIL